jgi:hypothetical protein
MATAFPRNIKIKEGEVSSETLYSLFTGATAVSRIGQSRIYQRVFERHEKTAG